MSACTKTRNNETKRPKRNHRNERNERNETTETTETSETSETAETKPPKRPKRAKINEKVKKYDLYLAPTIVSRVWHRDTTNSRRACKDEWAQAGRARRHREKAAYFSYFEWYSGKNKNHNILKKVSWSYCGFVGDGEWSFRERLCSIPRANRDFQLISREKWGRLGML